MEGKGEDEEGGEGGDKERGETRVRAKMTATAKRRVETGRRRKTVKEREMRRGTRRKGVKEKDIKEWAEGKQADGSENNIKLICKE